MKSAWIWKQANWPHFHWKMETLASMLGKSRLAQGKISGLIGLLDPNSAKEAISTILTEDSLTTSAIEGEQLDLATVRSSVARHLGLPFPKSRTSQAVDGLVETLLDATQQFNQPLTLERLCRWQAALFPTNHSGLVKIRTGKLRGRTPMQVVSGSIGHEKVHFLAPPREGLEAQVNDFLSWFNSSLHQVEGLIRAGLAHLWFVTLHPFEDGNGRIARAITDMAIAQDESQPTRLFSLSAQIMRERKAYYEILEKTQRGELEVTEWLLWFLAQIEKACIYSERIIIRTINKARFWLQFQNLKLNVRQRKVLNRLLDAGPGEFKGGMTTRKYISLTKTSRATAYRELAELVQHGCLIPIGKGGRSSAYDISWATFAI